MFDLCTSRTIYAGCEKGRVIFMKVLQNLKYTKTHEWVEFLGETTANVGITDYAQKELGDLVYVNLPEAGDEVAAGDTLCDVESVKAVSDVMCPVTGNVEGINQEIMDNPALINEDAYGAWFVRINDITGTDELMDADEYEKYVEEQSEKH
jgi:glycine cleavage system H protein